jgi:hypothetical protein
MLKLVLGLDLVRAVQDKRRKVDHMFQKDVAHLGYNRVCLLSLEERLSEFGVNSIYIFDVVKDSVDKGFPTRFWKEVHVPDWRDPFLIMKWR